MFAYEPDRCPFLKRLADRGLRDRKRGAISSRPDAWELGVVDLGHTRKLSFIQIIVSSEHVTHCVHSRYLLATLRLVYT
jgi:hypothetical protein